ncbi:hypothetical protein CI109_107113 [Kwoniella shandongensis]|uniref:Uncharacterized protein n=1 Tax=Kwoniella shandongensis TaxID=1734106 RepID=A0A5M6C6G5_9TREE|nr:uncharacterized protein CI109_002396 [Kwoniella shandongensis]KAA5529055.1 hypothetical protein CI109_002396 [Kwoniella shandongensis]
MLTTTTLIPLLSFLALASASPLALTKRYSGVKIQSYRDHKCLSPISDSTSDGTLVTTVDCANAKTWDINPGSGSVILHGVGLALDAGTGADNNEIVKLWTSYPTLFQQTWYLTGDNRIAITGGNQCLDEGDNGPQTYQCTTGNTNQIWNIIEGGGSGPVPSASVSPSASASASQSSAAPSSTGVPPGTVFKDPGYGSRRIHPVGRNDLCVTVSSGSPATGQQVNVAYCVANDSPYAKAQLWNITQGQNDQGIALSPATSSSLCLDVGYNPGSGSRLFVEDCSRGSLQHWDYLGDKVILHGRDLCLDLQKDSKPVRSQPIDIIASLQVWQCFPDNTQQIFTLLDI